jgi:hypothetical protein
VPTNSLLFHTAEEIRKERYKKEWKNVRKQEVNVKQPDISKAYAS